MNRSDAKKIAQTVTNQQLKDMLDRARNEVTDWTKPSIGNKGFTRGVAWNILGKDFDVNKNHHILYKINLVREFGEYLPNELKPIKKKKVQITPAHQNPIFD